LPVNQALQQRGPELPERRLRVPAAQPAGCRGVGLNRVLALTGKLAELRAARDLVDFGLLRLKVSDRGGAVGAGIGFGLLPRGEGLAVDPELPRRGAAPLVPALACDLLNGGRRRGTSADAHKRQHPAKAARPGFDVGLEKALHDVELAARFRDLRIRRLGLRVCGAAGGTRTDHARGDRTDDARDGWTWHYAAPL
jgi:hypothetical protein